MAQHNVHPFCRGSFVGALVGDSGDDALLMCGRVQDLEPIVQKKNWMYVTGTL